MKPHVAAGLALALLAGCLAAKSFAQTSQPDAHALANYDEAKVGTYTLPDPLTLQDGQPVRDAATWTDQRRPEILELFRENQHGHSPPAPADMSFNVFDNDSHALNGTAIRKQIDVYFTANKTGPKLHLLEYLPVSAAQKPAPLFLCISFNGVHRAIDDPAIRIDNEWDKKKKATSMPAEDTRGKGGNWPVEKILSHGYGFAVFNYCDVEPDFDGGLKYGVRALYLKPGQTDVGADEWGAIGAWAWGMSRAMDYLQTDSQVNRGQVIGLGMSRLGKTVLWAGAQDTRFSMIIACCSGESGAALSRRDFGETVKNMNTNFAYQFCANYKKFGDHVDQLPVDAHMLVALIAPRPLLLNTGSQDLWSDPRGEFLSAVAAGPVYRLLGQTDLATDQFPPYDTMIGGTLAYHCHTGKHEILPGDWDFFFKFTDAHLKAP